jgi:hypothetical protein
MKIKASLFSISNENGEVLHVKIVPSDDRQIAAKSYATIWNKHSEPLTQFIYSDNVVVGKIYI